MKGSQRNASCPCGSGKKQKRCHPDLLPPPEGNDTPKDSPWAIISAFSEELSEINRVLASHGPTDFVARLYLRSLFSMLDGYAYYVKHRALAGAKRAGIQLKREEIEVIFEMREKETRDGTRRFVPKILTTRDNLLFALKLYGRARNAEPPLVAGVLPAAFDVAAEARNRITHPKRPLDFRVLPHERQALVSLILWLRDVMDWVKNEELKNIDEIGTEIHESIERQRQAILRDHPSLRSTVRPEMTVEEMYTPPKLSTNE